MANKKAQVKIQQTALVLMAITLLFVLVGLFFISFKVGQTRGIVNSLKEKNSIILASKISENPEFSCGNAFGTSRVNCIDGDKLISLMTNPDKYSKLWGVSNIEVVKVLPENGQNQDLVKCNYENYPDCNDFWVFNETRRGFSSSSFVSLCHKYKNNGYLEDKCELSHLIIYYDKK